MVVHFITSSQPQMATARVGNVLGKLYVAGVGASSLVGAGVGAANGYDARAGTLKRVVSAGGYACIGATCGFMVGMVWPVVAPVLAFRSMG